MCGECLTDSLVQWSSFVTRSSREAAVWASQILPISAWVRSFIPPKVVQALASCWRTTTEIPMKHLSEGAVRFTHFQWRRVLGQETLLMLQAGGICWWGQSYHNQPGLGRVQVRVGRKDPLLFGMLRTAFSFWSKFTYFGWDSLNRIQVDESQQNQLYN